MKKFQNIIILSAGKSTRFWPLGDKNLFTFLGKTVTEHQIERFLPNAEKLIIVVNEGNGSQIQQIVQKLNVKNIQIAKQEGEGQASGLLSCQGLVTGEALVLNNDDFFDYQNLLPVILENKDKYRLILTAKEVTEYLPGGYLQVDGDVVKEVIEKPGEDKMPSHLFRLVVDYFGDFATLINALASIKTARDDYYEKGINKYISAYISGINKYAAAGDEKKSVYIQYDGYYRTLKFPWQVLTVMNYFLNALKKDQIRVGKNVKIAATAKVVGPTDIGDNTVIGDFALVRASHIGSNCLIGGYSEVTRSYLGDNVMLHRNYVGDSVLDENVFMGAGAQTANFRFDGKSIASAVNGTKINTGLVKLGTLIGEAAKIGVGAVILPGVKIGAGTYVGPGEVITEDVAEDRFIFQGKNKKNKP